MAIERRDRVKDSTTTTGTGTLTLSGTAPDGFRAFTDAHTTGATVRYAISLGTEWEVGEGVYTTSGNTLTRATVLASSNSGSLVNFSAGTKTVISTLTAAETLGKDGGTLTGLLTFAAGADVASAATIDLTAATGNMPRVTGTTATTNVTINAGQRVWCYAVGAWPLTHHDTNLPLPGSSSYICEAGDLVCFSKDGNGDKHVEISKKIGSGGGSFKNLIIGGDFSKNPWQRGTTFTAIPTLTYCADRFVFGNTSSAVCDILKTADAPTAAQAGMLTNHCLHLDVTTADAAIAAGDYVVIQNRVLGYNAAPLGFGQAGTRYCTLSFWVKSTKTGTFCCAFVNASANRSYVAEYTVNATDTWEKKTITFAVDTSGTWDYTTGIGLYIVWSVACGSTYQAAAGSWQAGVFFTTSNQVNGVDSSSNNFKLALPQFESGSAATAFENRPEHVEKELCEAYCEKSFIRGTTPAQNVGVNNGETNFMAGKAGAAAEFGYVRFRVQKRAAPVTITLYNPAAANAQVRDVTGGVDCSASATANVTMDGFRITATGNAATAVGNILAVHWIADSEL